VKGQRGSRHTQGIRQCARCRSFLASDHKSTKHLKSVRLRKGSQGFDNVFLFHIFIIMEIWVNCKAAITLHPHTDTRVMIFRSYGMPAFFIL